ncbi:hypothetical protein OH76DRAFT_149735 [Lentinus brumalis]|uniref:Secreted protein n=1 Tax=Lentinus brumalis TaxID=2498619 RepID=A0A371CP05_9APHY|nr:hypothetical protein OH76DRAFT_149735 [Polyporus brumalis]
MIYVLVLVLALSLTVALASSSHFTLLYISQNGVEGLLNAWTRRLFELHIVVFLCMFYRPRILSKYSSAPAVKRRDFTQNSMTHECNKPAAERSKISRKAEAGAVVANLTCIDGSTFEVARPTQPRYPPTLTRNR